MKVLHADKRTSQAAKRGNSALARIRRAAGFATVKAASGHVGYHAAYLRSLECGRSPLTGKSIYRLAKAYGITVEDFERRIARDRRRRSRRAA